MKLEKLKLSVLPDTLPYLGSLTESLQQDIYQYGASSAENYI